MTTTGSTGTSTSESDHWEWWEHQQFRRQRRDSRHPERAVALLRARAAASWVALAAVLVAGALDAGVRSAAVAFIGPAALCLVWFAIARTRTLSWRVVTLAFSGAVVWAVAVAAAAPLTGSVIVEDALLLLPLAGLVIAVPGRVRRFAVADWLVLGAALGLGFQAVEVSARALAAQLGAPSPVELGTGSGTRYLAFVLLGLTLGTGIAMVRHGRGATGRAASAGQVLGAALPLAGLAVLLGSHLPPGGGLPLALRVLRFAGAGLTFLVVAVVVLALTGFMMDTRRVRATDEPGTDRLPFPFSASDTADRWTLAITGPGNSGPGSMLLYSLTAGVWAACCLVAYTVRDALFVLGAHLRLPKEPVAQARSRGRAAATLTRLLRSVAFSQLDSSDGTDSTGGERDTVRRAGIAALVLLAVLGGLLARLGADAPVPWLGDAIGALSDGGRELGSSAVAAAVALVAALVLITGAPGTAMTEDGRRRRLMEHGRGTIAFSPAPTPAERVQTSTVAELVLDALTGVITLIPGPVLRPVVGSAASGPAQALVAEFCADPARLIARRRRQVSSAPDDTGAMLAVRTGTWDAASRRRWVDSRVSSRAYRITSADGRTSVPADGLALTSDGVAMLEASHLHRPDAAMLFEGRAPALLAERLLAPFDDEMRRYATVIRDPHNPVGRLRLIVGSDRAALLLGGRAREILGPDLDMFVVVDLVEA